VKAKEALERKRGGLERSVREGVRMAVKSGDDKRMRVVRSKRKKLEERFGEEVNEKGHRFKLNRDFGGYHLTNREDITLEDLDPPITLPIPDPDPQRLRFPGALVSASDVSFRYEKRGAMVLDGVSLTVHPGARVGLVGKNGQGKSTLVKLLVGGGGMRPEKGSLERHTRMKLGPYFISQLQSKEQIQVDEGTARGFLGSYGLKGQTVLNPIGTLSGGQKVRLALALIAYPAPDLLVLDEVSTHLDMDTTAGLIRALKRYKGAVLLVSHDRHLVRCVVEGAPILNREGESGEEDDESEEEEEDFSKERLVYRVGPKGKIKLLRGVDEYVEMVERRLAR